MKSDHLLEGLFKGETVNTLKASLGLTVEEIYNAISETDLVVCPHCLTVSHIGGLIGDRTNDCPVCEYSILL